MPLALASNTAELVGLLTDELGLYDQLLVLARREREAVLGSDPLALEALVAEKETLLVQVGRLESRRQAWVASWAAEAGLDPVGLTLSAVTAGLPAVDAAALEAAREALVERVRELTEAGFRNRNLVSSALGVVSRRLDAYNRFTTSLGYRASGATVKSALVAQLDLRA